jgi:hypothetical protein
MSGLKPVENVKMQNQNNRTLTVQEDPLTGDLYLQLTDELMEEMSWSEGDTLQWIDNEDGTWSLKKLDAPTMEKTKPIL